MGTICRVVPKCAQVLCLLLSCLTFGQTSQKLDYRLATYIGYQDYGRLALLSSNPVTFGLFGNYANAYQGSLKMTFADKVCTVEGMGIKKLTDIREAGESPTDLVNSGNAALPSFLFLQFTVMDSIKMHGGTYRVRISSVEDSPMLRFQLSRRIGDKKGSTGFPFEDVGGAVLGDKGTDQMPLFLRAFDLDGDEQEEICYGFVEGRFQGIAVLSTTPDHFKALRVFFQKVMKQLVDNDVDAGLKMYSRGVKRTFPLQ